MTALETVKLSAAGQPARVLVSETSPMSRATPVPDLLGALHVPATEPAAPYLGGKRNLAKRIVRILDSEAHETYAEPFVGMGGIFLRRRIARPLEVINDWSLDLATFYRVVQRHYAAFLDMLKFQITSRREFERLQATDPDTLTDMERAARFLYLQVCGFGGKVAGRSFGVSPGYAGAFNVYTIASRLDALHERLGSVQIERLPFADFITRYDRPATLFYLDPPYWGGENDYGKGMFARDDFQRLAGQLAGIEGRFILSINDVPEIREIFGAFDMEAVELKYGVAKGIATDARELIIRGGG